MEIPVHHKLESILDRYLDASGLRDRPDSPLFLAARGKTHKLTDRAIDRVAAWMMVKRKLKDAGIPTIYSNHSFRAAGITNFLENGGNLEMAQRIAGHADSRTTKLYDRRGQKVLVKDMERIISGTQRAAAGGLPASALVGIPGLGSTHFAATFGPQGRICSSTDGTRLWTRVEQGRR